MSVDAIVAVEAAIEAQKQGRFVIVVDDERRENEGDLIMPAECVTPAAIAFMVRHTTGIVCVSMEAGRLENLNIGLMVPTNSDHFRTAFTVSVDYRHGTTTGVSAQDRALTIKALADPKARPEDFARPGHIFPLQYRRGGVLVRAGHTEAAVDLARLAGFGPTAILCELVNDDGSMMRLPQLQEFAQRHSLPMVSIDAIIEYRRRRETLVRRVAEGTVRTRFGDFLGVQYQCELESTAPFALLRGDVAHREGTLVRVHVQDAFADALGLHFDAAMPNALDHALERISDAGHGVFVYIPRRADYDTQTLFRDRTADSKRDAAAAGEPNTKIDWRETGIGSQILLDLGATRLRLLADNDFRYSGLDGYGIKVIERVPLRV